MKKIVALILSVTVAINSFAATKNVVPGVDGEGSIGTLTNRWGSGYFRDVYILNGINVTNFVVSGTNFGGSDVIAWNNNIITAIWASNGVVILNGLTNGWNRWQIESNLYYRASNPSNYLTYVTNHNQSYATITGLGTAATNNSGDFQPKIVGTVLTNGANTTIRLTQLGTNYLLQGEASAQTDQVYCAQAGTSQYANVSGYATGLDSATSNSFATAAQGSKADTALQGEVDTLQTVVNRGAIATNLSVTLGNMVVDASGPALFLHSVNNNSIKLSNNSLWTDGANPGLFFGTLYATFDSGTNLGSYHRFNVGASERMRLLAYGIDLKSGIISNAIWSGNNLSNTQITGLGTASTNNSGDFLSSAVQIVTNIIPGIGVTTSTNGGSITINSSATGGGITNNQTGITLSGSFSGSHIGNGSGLTNIPNTSISGLRTASTNNSGDFLAASTQYYPSNNPAGYISSVGKVSSATNADVSGYATGLDSATSNSFATAAQGSKADTALQYGASYTNISGLGTVVTHGYSEFASSAQGLLAASALQPADTNGWVVSSHSAFVTNNGTATLTLTAGGNLNANGFSVTNASNVQATTAIVSRVVIGAAATNSTALIEMDASASAVPMIQVSRTGANAGLRLLNYNGATGRNSFEIQGTLNSMTNWLHYMHFDVNTGRIGIRTNSAATTLDVNGAVTIRGATDHQGNAITNISTVSASAITLTSTNMTGVSILSAGLGTVGMSPTFNSVYVSSNFWFGGATQEVENQSFGWLSGSNTSAYAGSFQSWNDTGVEWYFQNKSSSNNAYGEIEIYNDDDQAHANYFAFGRNSSQWTNTAAIGRSNDCYIAQYNPKGIGDLLIGNVNTQAVRFFVATANPNAASGIVLTDGLVTQTNTVINGNLNGVPQWTWVRNTVNYSTTNTTSATMADATNLGFQMTAGKCYLIQGWINHTSSAASIGIWLGVRGPAYTALAGRFISPMTGITMADIPVTTTNVCAGPSTTSFSTLNNLNTFDCYYECGATNGYFNITFAAEVTGAVGIKSNSVLQYRTLY